MFSVTILYIEKNWIFKCYCDELINNNRKFENRLEFLNKNGYNMNQVDVSLTKYGKFVKNSHKINHF